MALVLLAGAAAQPARAQVPSSRLAAIADRGVLRAGTRPDARPFAFRTDSGSFGGFSVDLLSAIHERLDRRLDPDIELSISGVSSTTRFERIENGELDIVCGLTTITWPRERRVDFTLPFFVDGTKLLTYREHGQRGLSGLRGRRVGVLKGATTQRIVRSALPSAELVRFPRMSAAMDALAAREVAAVSNIGILLEKLRKESPRAASLTVIPDTVGLNRETMGCILPENESALRDTINRILADMMSGLADLSGPYADVYFDWFGVDGVLFYPLTEKRRRILRGARVWLQ